MQYGMNLGLLIYQPVLLWEMLLIVTEESFQTWFKQHPKKVIKGEKSGKEALMEIGETIRGLIIQSIATAQAWAVPNDPKTLKIKTKNGQTNNTKPLLDNRFLIKSIRYQIVNKNGTIEYLSDFKDV